MKTIIFVAIMAFAATNCYDVQDVDMSELVKTDELKKLIDCQLDRAECSKLYSTYKAVTSEAIKQACEKCTSYQKQMFWKFLEGVKAQYPNDYYNFRQKYDPENKYFDALEAELDKYSKY